MVRPSGFEPPTFCSGGKESMPKGKQSYVPGLGKKSVARHSGEVRKPVSIALSTQFSTRLALSSQFTLAVNERLTFLVPAFVMFSKKFSRKVSEDVGCVMAGNIGKRFRSRTADRKSVV